MYINKVKVMSYHYPYRNGKELKQLELESKFESDRGLMIKKLFLLLIIISLYSCQSVKDALSGKKYESSDEFLVIKKNMVTKMAMHFLLLVVKKIFMMTITQSV